LTQKSIKSKKPWRLYLLIPILSFILNILISYLIFKVESNEEIDSWTFFNSARYLINQPEIAYIDNLETNNMLKFVYLPFFGYIFYPMTLWGFETFKWIVLISGCILLIVSIVFWDNILRRRNVPTNYRLIFLILMTIGLHFFWNVYYGQLKYHITFLITLIIELDDRNSSSWKIHILFQILISIMTHWIFWYFYFVLKHYKAEKGENPNKGEKLNQKVMSNSYKEKMKFKNLLKECIIGISFFVLFNSLFIIHPTLIEGYLSQVFGEHLGQNYEYINKVKFSIVPYFLYELFAWTQILLYLLLIILSVCIFIMFKKNLNLLDSASIYSIILIIFDPLNETHYYIYFYAISMITIAQKMSQQNLNERKKIISNYIILLLLGFIIVSHLFLLPPYRQFVYILYISIYCSNIYRKQAKNKL
jgi:hypothetical protein